MLRRVVGLSLAVLILATVMVGGTWAYLRDSETSSSNPVSAGTLNLTTDDANGVSETLYTLTFKPGQNIPKEDAASITLKNTGSLAGSHMRIKFNYTNSDDSSNLTAKSADDTAKNLEISLIELACPDRYDLMTYDSTHVPNVPSSGLDLNSNTWVDLNDLYVATNTYDYLSDLDGLAAGDSGTFAIQLKVADYNSSTFNTDYQNDGVAITITFTLYQN